MISSNIKIGKIIVDRFGVKIKQSTYYRAYHLVGSLPSVRAFEVSPAKDGIEPSDWSVAEPTDGKEALKDGN